MRLHRPDDLAPGERPLALAPPLATHVDGAWNRRVNLLPGRTLDEAALAREQAHRERHQARLGARLSPGIVEGLEIAVEAEGDGPDTLVVAPGRGLAASGQDVVLRQALRLGIDALPRLGAGGRPRRPDEGGPARGTGLLLLLPIVVGQERAADRAARDRAFLDPCPDDEDAVAFADLRLEDGVLLGFHPWPADWPDLAAEPALRRNLLAFEIFRREAAAAPSRTPLPWSSAGVALALVVIDDDGRIVLLDRAAVARKGGAAAPRRPLDEAAAETRTLFAARGTPFLWQARIEQLLVHAAELVGAGEELADASAHFRHLPPVGVLPRPAWGEGDGFFPESWLRLSVPVPLEQLELALEAAAGLAPFDLELDDAVLWLVPVPQALFEPRLLVEEAVHPEFLDTLGRLQAALGESLLRRDRLRAMRTVTARALDPALERRIERELADDAPLPGEDAIPPPDPDTVPPPTAHDGATLERLRRFFREELDAGLRGLLTPRDLAGIDPGGDGSAIANPDFAGLGPFIERLTRRLGRAEDTVDLGFTRLQAEVYRVRQIMLDNEEATRLATSPVLAGVVREASSALVANDAIRAYFAGGGARPAPPPAPAPAIRPASVTFAARPAQPAPGFDLGRVVREAQDEAVRRLVAVDPVRLRQSIGQKLAIPGEVKDFRTVTVADRLKVSAATEAKSAAVRLKADIVAEVQGLDLHLAGITAPILPRGHAVLAGHELVELRERLRRALAQLDISVDAERQLLAPRLRQLTSGQGDEARALHLVDLGPVRPNETQILNGRVAAIEVVDALLADARDVAPTVLALDSLPALILAGAFDPDPPDGDEAAFLSQAIATLEGTVGLLRSVEGRIEGQKRLLDLARIAHADLLVILEAWREDLAETDRVLAERRHDLAVADSLLAEETRRIEGINRRRREILLRHVPFVAYMRPRTVSARAGRDMPIRPALTLDVADEPACPHGQEAPPALAELLAVLREVPIGWLADLAPLVARLDRPAVIAELYAKAARRARLMLDEAPAIAGPSAPRALEAAVVLARAYGGTIRSLAEARAALEPALVARLGAREARTRAARELSLADLETSARIRPRELEQAERALARIEDVATCLVRRIEEVPVAIRLGWVQRLSVFDPAIDLSRPERLPGWAALPFPLAREILRLVRWLVERVDPKVAVALGLMSDVVRVAILVASHAPAAAIVAGRIATAQQAATGDLVEVAIDRNPPRLGGQVQLREGELRVEGVVEDVGAGKALVRVVAASSPVFRLGPGTTAHFLATSLQGT